MPSITGPEGLPLSSNRYSSSVCSGFSACPFHVDFQSLQKTENQQFPGTSFSSYKIGAFFFLWDHYIIGACNYLNSRSQFFALF